MTVVENLSACIKIVFTNGTTIYLYQTGHTSHMQWVMECLQTQLKDSRGTDQCVFPLALSLNQWNGCPNLVNIGAEPTHADLRLTFDFQNASVSGTYRQEEFEMEMIEWMGTPFAELPFVTPWGLVDDLDDMDFDAACAALAKEIIDN